MTIARRMAGLGAALVLVPALGCSGADEPATRPIGPIPRQPAATAQAHVRFSSELRVEVELAVEAFDRERGLMYRRYLAPRTGMLFVFESMGPREFHMENTFIPLDILFIDHERYVVGIREDNRPLSLEGVAVEAHSQYVLEVSAGFVRRHGIAVGDRVDFEGFEAVGSPSHEQPVDAGPAATNQLEDNAHDDGSEALDEE